MNRFFCFVCSEKTINLAKDCHVERERKKRYLRNVFKSLKSNFKYIAGTLIVGAVTEPFYTLKAIVCSAAELYYTFKGLSYCVHPVYMKKGIQKPTKRGTNSLIIASKRLLGIFMPSQIDADSETSTFIGLLELKLNSVI